MKLPFLHRNTVNSEVPAEIQEYYQSEHRERVGVAWLLAGGTLVLTLLLATGLFFGGKWVYDKIANREDENTVSTTQTTEETTTPTPTPAPVAENPPAPTGTSSTSTSVPSNTAVAPAVTTQPQSIPHTGPDSQE